MQLQKYKKMEGELPLLMLNTHLIQFYARKLGVDIDELLLLSATRYW